VTQFEAIQRLITQWVREYSDDENSCPTKNMLANSCVAQAQSDSACAISPPEGRVQSAVRWDGACHAGVADGLGVLKESSRKNCQATIGRLGEERRPPLLGVQLAAELAPTFHVVPLHWTLCEDIGRASFTAIVYNR
jgi:hypothetical protein